MVGVITWKYNKVLYHVAKVNVLVHFPFFSQEGSGQLCWRLGGAEEASPERESEGKVHRKTSSYPGRKGTFCFFAGRLWWATAGRKGLGHPQMWSLLLHRYSLKTFSGPCTLVPA